MNKLISSDNLDRLSKGLYKLLKDLIAEEENRASASEQSLSSEITRVENMLGGKSIIYLTQAEYDDLTDSEKNSNTITYFITDEKKIEDFITFNDNKLWLGTQDEYELLDQHDTDIMYLVLFNYDAELGFDTDEIVFDRNSNDDNDSSDDNDDISVTSALNKARLNNFILK